MESPPANIPTRDEAMKRGGPCSALRLVDTGEDPRILSTNPDHFFRKPWKNANLLALVALVVASALAVRFITIEAWDSDLPWGWNMIWLIVPWVPLAPVWRLWIWRRRSRARVYRGRKAIAAVVNGTPAERGEAIWVSYNSEDYVNRRGLDMMIVAEASGQKMVFVDARSKRRPRPGGQLFRIGDPIWLWRGADGWVFGQIALDPTYSPADHAQPPSWEEMHGGHSPEYFITKMSVLAAQFRSGDLSRDEYEAAKNRLLNPGGRWNS